jgi:hypothetical protein
VKQLSEVGLEEVKPLSQMNKLLKYSTIAAIGALKI